MIERIKSAMVGLGASWVLWLMLALSVISLAIMLERAWLFWSLRDDLPTLMRDLGRFLRAGDLEGARQRLEQSPSAEAAVVIAGIVEADLGPDAAEEAMATTLPSSGSWERSSASSARSKSSERERPA